ncbi:TPA: hypothetical protein HA296_06045 [Candidatus Woesearchaeota archaeon]|nr:hypothetical protein [Candidatus Woesearchaeota archaeon]
MGKNVAFLFHMYQPPWQDEYVLERIVDECYSWFTAWLADQSDVHATVNINYSLTELLVKHGHTKVIENLGRGVERGLIELTSSAAYHALLPLIPEREIWRQIELNEKGNGSVFSGIWKPEGFFPPELAFSPALARILSELGYSWTINDAVAYQCHNGDTIPHHDIGILEGIPLFFRADWSNKFAMEYPKKGWGTDRFVTDMNGGISGWFQGREGYLILAFDMETIGHHLNGFYDLWQMEQLADHLRRNQIAPVTISALLGLFPERRGLPAHNEHAYCSSWSTPFEDVKQAPYPLWYHPQNPTHSRQWDLLNYAVGLVNSLEDEGIISPDHPVRGMLDRALNSCPFWWANIGRWSPDIIMEGAKNVYGVIEAAADTLENGYRPVVHAEANRLYQAVQLFVEGKPRPRPQGIVEARMRARQGFAPAFAGGD